MVVEMTDDVVDNLYWNVWRHSSVSSTRGEVSKNNMEGDATLLSMCSGDGWYPRWNVEQTGHASNPRGYQGNQRDAMACDSEYVTHYGKIVNPTRTQIEHRTKRSIII